MRMFIALLVAMSAGMLLTGCGSHDVAIGEGTGAEAQSELFAAIQSGDLDGVKEQVSANPALVNQPEGNFSWTPLHKAAATNQTEIAKFLLENGANVNAFDAIRMTPLVIANDVGASEEMIQLLKAAGGDD